MIVKCQRSLATTEDTPRMLFYDRTRAHLGEFALTEEWNAHFGATTAPQDNRFFADVEWRDHRPPRFIRRVREQGW
jgi:hypothetical protein